MGMLVLQRRSGESLTIDTGCGIVTFKVLGMASGQVKLGIDAPRAMSVLRDNAVSHEPKQRAEPKENADGTGN